MGKLYDLSTSMIVDMYRALEDQGFTEESVNDPETQGKLMESMQTIWRDLTAKVMEASADISDLNRRAYKSLAVVLPADTAGQLRHRFYSKAYMEAEFANRKDPVRFGAALKLDALTEDQRQALTTAQSEFDRKISAILEDAVTLIDDNKRDFSPFDFNSEKMQEYNERLGELRVKATELTTSATATLAATLGPELTEKLQLAAAEDAAGDSNYQAQAQAMAAAVAAEKAAAEGAAESKELDFESAAGEAQFLAPRIAARELDEYADVLRLTEDQRAIVRQFHSTYMEQFQLIRDKEIAELNKAVHGMWKHDAATGQATGPTLEQIDETHRLRRAAIDAIRRADNAFFDDIELSVATSEQQPFLKRVRMARERLTYNRTHQLMFVYSGEGTDSSIDLSRLVLRQKLEEPALKALEPVLVAYEDAATPAFRTKYELSLKMQHAQERWQSEIAAAQADGETNFRKLTETFRETMGEISKAVTEATAQLGKINRESLEKLIAVLPADAGETLRHQYNLKAYPKIYGDSGAIDRHLNAALRLEDLTDDQRRKINDLAAEYRPAYAALCDQMMQITAGAAPLNFAAQDREGWSEFQQRHENMSKLRFDRDEVNQRAAGQLRSILSEDQIRQIGGLPTPPKRSEFDMFD
ncbi:MAG: hypothetical protein L0Y42_03415 [Phycisphaerales bacterium]|nr:hypothetical protein [Phycisphaerales bacterium]